MKRRIAGLLLAGCMAAGIWTPPAAGAAGCGVPGLSKLTDPLAGRMENGETLIWEGVSPDLLRAKQKYEELLAQRGWHIVYASAHRPYQYQRHFYEIVTRLRSGKMRSGACAGLRRTLQAEYKKHGLTGAVAKPNPEAPHVKGIAFDAAVFDGKGRRLNPNGRINPELVAVARQAGLQFTVPGRYAVHHQLIPGMMRQTAAIGKKKTVHQPVLRQGSRGAAVITLQKALSKKGYKAGKADGVFGQATKKAVVRFQRDRRLKADGIVSAATWKKLIG
ncbi:peptidoglycan-binding domain-containing protein [Ectobacillus ponti]|uniref:Peptidoglycan-binding protein n=1 Tax=Ectobacillus ponti TaxID=2961894 RepID=A0AA41X816_9BACI|nr:peptidoglycan-binding protein [Ectobacillus ponti]MCP8968585.1 peptidoglycan-binding protein [Ectobacillus ponti]